MSEVFLGYDPTALRPAAVKVLADHLAGTQQFVNRFYREAILTRRLAHPSLIRGLAHGFDPAANKHFLVLELVDGPTAQAVLERSGRFPPGVAVRITLDVAAALGYLHDHRLVHRDVKPENVLLQPAPPAKLADLGLAKRVATDGHLTAANEGFGTPHYMPFEQAVNAALADARSDVFALGATLYHLLTGRVPFPDADADPSAPRPPFEPAHAVCAEVPAALDPVLGRMLAADPRGRFQSAAEVAAALERAGPVCTAGEYTAFVTRAAVEVGDPTGDGKRDDQPTRYAPRNTA
jgi:serine/threonine-protein kinase